MHRLFWTFCSFLIILTIISTIGGGIRYRENFMDEVLDNMYDEVQDVDSNVLRTLTNLPVVDEEQIIPEATIPVEEIVTPSPEIVKTPTPSKVMGVNSDTDMQFKPLDVVEAFNGNVYATF